MSRTRYTADMILEIYRRNKNGESLREVSKSLGLNGRKALENILYRLDRTMKAPFDRYATDVMRKAATILQGGKPSGEELSDSVRVQPVSSGLAHLEAAMSHLQDTIVDFVAQEVEKQSREERVAIAKERKDMAILLATAKRSNWLNKLSERFPTELEE